MRDQDTAFGPDRRLAVRCTAVSDKVASARRTDPVHSAGFHRPDLDGRPRAAGYLATRDDQPQIARNHGAGREVSDVAGHHLLERHLARCRWC